jgi:hypothetical protein
LEITGSDLKMSFPQSILSKVILVDHVEQWNQKGKYIYIMVNGMICKKDLLCCNDKITNELIIKELHKENKITEKNFGFFGLDFNCLQINNTKEDNFKCNIGLILLCDKNEHYQNHNSVSINNWTTLKPHLRKLVDDKVHIYYYLHRQADFMLEMKLLDLEDLEYNAYITSKNKKYCDFSQPFNSIGNHDTKLVIETHVDNMSYFEKLNIFSKGVYVNDPNRKKLAYL